MQISAKEREDLKAHLLLGMGIDPEPIRLIKSCKCGQEIHQNSTLLEMNGLKFKIKCSKCKAVLLNGELQKAEDNKMTMYR